ncbi:MAG: hypothetical protein EAX89_01795 [Candidatus Lokiarchaeota archaeon]|nr:hypothetical protein [Candidatus Lokiarchaeota archaeon]
MGETTPSKLKFSVTAPSGATKVVALMAALVLIREGIWLFWNTADINIFFGIMEIILAGILIIVLNIVDFGVPFFKKLFLWWIILILGILVLMFEIFASGYDILTAASTGFLLGGLLVVIAAILELVASKQKMKASQIVALFGAAYTIFEVILLFLNPSTQTIYHGILGIIFVALLLISMQKKIDLKIRYEWWVVLIIGFVLYSWVTSIPSVTFGTGGTIVLISFILMLLAL